MGLAALGPLPIGIKGLAQMALCPCIHQEIARPSVIAQEHGAQPGDISDATNIDHSTQHFRVRKQGLMKGGYQWRALACRCNVPATEIGDHRDAGRLGDAGGRIQLDRVSEPRLVPQGLAMHAECNDIPAGEFEMDQALQYCAADRISQTIGYQRATMQFIVAALL